MDLRQCLLISAIAPPRAQCSCRTGLICRLVGRAPWPSHVVQAPKAMDTTGLKGMMNVFGQAARPTAGRGAPMLLLIAASCAAVCKLGPAVGAHANEAAGMIRGMTVEANPPGSTLSLPPIRTIERWADLCGPAGCVCACRVREAGQCSAGAPRAGGAAAATR